MGQLLCLAVRRKLLLEIEFSSCSKRYTSSSPAPPPPHPLRNIGFPISLTLISVDGVFGVCNDVAIVEWSPWCYVPILYDGDASVRVGSGWT